MRKTKLITLITTMTLAAVGAVSLCLSENNAIDTAATSDQTYILCGSINGWDTNNTDYKFTWNGSNSQYELLDVPLSSGTEFKVTRKGGWDYQFSWNNYRSGGANFSNSNGNIKCNTTSRYSFYAKDWDNWDLYISKASYSVTLHKDGGTGFDLESYQYGETKTLSALTKTNYIFDGWFDNVGLTGNPITSITSTDHGNKEYWAKFHVDPASIKYTVTFMNEDGTKKLGDVEVAGGSTASFTTPTKDSEGNKVFTFDKWVTKAGGTTAATLSNVSTNMTVYASFKMDYKHGFYVMGTLNGGDWGLKAIENGYLMSEFADKGYAYAVRATIEANYGEEFKIVYYGSEGIDWDQSFGFSTVQQDSPALYCFGDKDGNIKTWASGSYTINLHNFDGQNKTMYIKFEDDSSRNAEQLAAKLMSYGIDLDEKGSGQCGDKYEECKAIFNSLSPEEKANFLDFALEDEAQFKNAYDRLMAWATAKGESVVDADGSKTLKSFNRSSAIFGENPITGENSTTLWIVIATSLAAVASIGGFAFYKKRKEN